jgi:hypothetical protein
MTYGRPRAPGRWPGLASGCHFVAEGRRPLDLGMTCGPPRDPGRWPGLAWGCHVVAEDGRPLDLGLICGRPRAPGRWPGLASGCHFVAEDGAPRPSPEGAAPRQPRPTAWEPVMTRAESPEGGGTSFAPLHHIPTRSGWPASRPRGHQRSDRPRYTTSRRGPVGPHRDRPATNVRIALVTPRPDAIRSARIATVRPPTFGSPPLHHVPTRSGWPASRPRGHQPSDRPVGTWA